MSAGSTETGFRLSGSAVLLTLVFGTTACSGEGFEQTKAALNVIPVADAGPDQNNATGKEALLDGSASHDPDGDLLSYRWLFTQMPKTSTAVLRADDTVAPRFTPDVDGTYVAQLIVNDGSEDSEPDTVVVVASAGNSAPVADAGPDQNATPPSNSNSPPTAYATASARTVFPGAEVTLSGWGFDENKDPLTYNWWFDSKPASSGAVLSDPASRFPTFTANVAGSYDAKLVVSDGQSQSAPASVTVTAIPARCNSIGGTPTTNGEMEDARHSVDGDLNTSAHRSKHGAATIRAPSEPQAIFSEGRDAGAWIELSAWTNGGGPPPFGQHAVNEAQLTVTTYREGFPVDTLQIPIVIRGGAFDGFQTTGKAYVSIQTTAEFDAVEVAFQSTTASSQGQVRLNVYELCSDGGVN